MKREAMRHYIGKRIIGKHYRPSQCRCGVMPWEPCGCPGMLNIEPMRTPEPIKTIADLFNAEADERLRMMIA